MAHSQIALRPIGWVRSPVRELIDDFWGDVTSRIEIDARLFTSDCISGLGSFSHIEVLFYMHLVDDASIASGIRHPRDNPNWPAVGVFAQRVKARPNRIAATVCRLIRVENTSLITLGLDAVDGSPVLDIKPVFRQFYPSLSDVRQPKWVDELMSDYFRPAHKRHKS